MAGMDVVVCLTDSDAAPDPGWTEVWRSVHSDLERSPNPEAPKLLRDLACREASV